MGKRLDGRVAIVTGASSGIGSAIALAYGEEGASVVCADLQQGQRESPKMTDELIRDFGGKAYFVQTDVREEQQIEVLIASAVRTYGRLDMQVPGTCKAKP